MAKAITWARPALVSVTALAILVVLSTGDSAGRTLDASAASASAKETRNLLTISGGKRVRTGRTRFGTILQDSRRRTLYLFTKERRKRSRCYGACAKAWPPLITRGKPVAIRGARQSKLSTTRRRSGKRQVTYNGHPLYYYVDEDEPNEVLCQAVREFGGLWYVVNRNGRAIRKR